MNIFKNEKTNSDVIYEIEGYLKSKLKQFVMIGTINDTENGGFFIGKASVLGLIEFLPQIIDRALINSNPTNRDAVRGLVLVETLEKVLNYNEEKAFDVAQILLGKKVGELTQHE